MATDNPRDDGAAHARRPDDPYRTLEQRRLRERIAALEDRRARLMAAVRHMRQGKLDDSYLDDVLRAELADIPHGVLLESIEIESDCLRRRLGELERGGNVTQALRRWQDLDWQVNARLLDAEEAMDQAIEGGLARRTMGPGPPDSITELWMIEPARGAFLVPGPLLLIAFGEHGYGGPRLYRPVSDELRWDTGLFS